MNVTCEIETRTCHEKTKTKQDFRTESHMRRLVFDLYSVGVYSKWEKNLPYGPSKCEVHQFTEEP